MNLAYTIISVDDSRKVLREGIEEDMTLPLIKEIEFVDARIDGVVEEYMAKNNVRIENAKFHRGELGVWFSQINCWKWIAESEYDAVIVFEDDAVVQPDLFQDYFPSIIADLPSDFDFLSLAVPYNQHEDYAYDRHFHEDGSWELYSDMKFYHSDSRHYIGSDVVATAYQGYGCISIMYSRAGARKLLDLVEKNGMYTPVDCFIFLENFKGNLNGYAPVPTIPKFVSYVELGTIARSTEMFN